VRDVDLQIARGSLHAVIGPNGAGKTTLFNMLTGQLSPTAGQIFVHGAAVHQTPVHERVKHGLARSFQITSVFDSLTVRENGRLAAQGRHARQALRFWPAALENDKVRRRVDETLQRVGLEKRAARIAGELSHGEQRLLEVAMALAPNPDVLLLDEPMSGMGIDDVPLLEHLLGKLKSDFTIVMVENNMAVTMRLAYRITVMVAGQVLVEGAPSVVRSDERVQKAYLGEEG
jgi:branched-chain amino acid transport system ATP-binding protein